jgi:hypothetical protein
VQQASGVRGGASEGVRGTSEGVRGASEGVRSASEGVRGASERRTYTHTEGWLYRDPGPLAGLASSANKQRPGRILWRRLGVSGTGGECFEERGLDVQ